MHRPTFACALALAFALPTASLAQDRKPAPQGKAKPELPAGHPTLPPGAVPPGHPPFPAGVSPHDPVAMLKALGATPEQTQKVLELHHTGMLRAIDLKAAIQKAELQLKFVHQKPDATAKEFMDAIDAAAAAKANLMKAHVSLSFELKAAVGDELFKKLKNHLPLLHGGQAHPGMDGAHPGMAKKKAAHSGSSKLAPRGKAQRGQRWGKRADRSRRGDVMDMLRKLRERMRDRGMRRDRGRRGNRGGRRSREY